MPSSSGKRIRDENLGIRDGATVLPAMASGPGPSKKGSQVTIACPATWPGPGNEQARIWDTNVFKGYFSVQLPAPENPKFSGEGPYEIQMDCIYEGGLHLTLEVPGHPVTCYNIQPPDRRRTNWPGVCITRPGPDGKLGPVRQIPAESITLETLIQGFGLRWPPERVVEAARAGGYAAQSEKGKIVAAKEADRVEIFFSDTTGLSREVVWFGPEGPKDAKLAFAKAFALRFGLTVKYRTTPNSVTDRHRNPPIPVGLDYVETGPLMSSDRKITVHLIDLADPANEGAR